MRVDVLTLFPDTMNAIFGESILGRAQKKGILHLEAHQIRDYTTNKQNQVDDYPYGGGQGAIMQADPLYRCWCAVQDDIGGHAHTVYMSPCGKTFTEEDAKRLAKLDNLILVCGHYEGIDQRFIDECVDEEISLGDFVLTGGEIAAMAVADSVCRLVPGVLADEACYTGESHWDGLLEYPQYTRPEVWEGRKVPEVLLGGNHGEIEEWRRTQSLERTMRKRPDLFAAFEPSAADQKRIEHIKKQQNRRQLSEPLTCRKAEAADLPAIMEIVRQARNSLKKHRVDQWQGEYPSEALLASDIERGVCHVLCYRQEIAAFLVLTPGPEEGYDELTDGKWHTEMPYAVAHRSAVKSDFRGTGTSKALLDAVEALAREMGATAVRTDTHRKNKAMKELLGKCGYRFAGNVMVTSEPGHDPRRQAFEKIL